MTSRLDLASTAAATGLMFGLAIFCFYLAARAAQEVLEVAR